MSASFLDGYLKKIPFAFSPRHSNLLKIALVVISVILTTGYLFSGGSESTHSYQHLYEIVVTGEKGSFVDKVVATEIDGPFDNQTLAELCATRTWMPGLIFECEPAEGEIANVRNAFLNCVRYAIEAGATSFVIPEIGSWGTTPATAQQKIKLPFEHFFDLQHFTTTLSSACPQMELIPHTNDLWDVPSTAEPVRITTSDFITDFTLKTVLAAPGNWSSEFTRKLNIKHPIPFSAERPALVILKAPLLEFPLTYDNPHFPPTFSRILRFRPDVRRIAGTVLYALSSKHKLSLDPYSIHPGKFYGAQLYTKRDTKTGWTPIDVQSSNYLASATSLQLPIIYLTSDDADTASFINTAADVSMVVETKESLLSGETTYITNEDGDRIPQKNGKEGFESEWQQLQSFNAEQRELVDYEVLLRASSFGGTWESRFSWNIAMKRHAVAGAGRWVTNSEPPPQPDNTNLPEGVNSPDRKRAVNARHPRSFSEERRQNARAENERRDESGQDKDANKDAAPTTRPITKIGVESFRDSLSVVYGPEGESEIYLLSMWP